MSTRCECTHPIPEGRGYCFRCGYPMGVEASKRAKADRAAKEAEEESQKAG
ncbi:MAG: hypothetical protein Q7S53_05600 [bacterium]|nr:hypothetical protein [bacterium]